MVGRVGAVPYRERGFGLIEVMATLVLVALIAGVVTVGMRPGLDAASVRSEAVAIRAVLADARTAAIVARVPVTVGVDPARGRVDVGHPSVAGRVLPRDLRLETGTGAQPLRLVFRPDGSSSGGAFAIAARGRRIVLTVNWLTGRVDVTQSTEGRR